MTRLFICLILVSLVVYPGNSQSVFRNGVVSSASHLSSEVGVDVLKKGGNAVDAAVATAFSLAVTWPTAGNIGGGGFMVISLENGDVTTIDFRETAPAAATTDMYLDDEGNLDRFRNTFHPQIIGVPGTVAGLYMAHQKYGKLSWEEVVQPAVDQALEGIEFTGTLYQHALRYQGERSEKFPAFRRYFYNADGEITQPGEVWKQPALGKTLILIRDKGADGFYRGEVAARIARFMKENEGLITKKDLKNYKAIERKPIKGTYKGYDIYGMPPPSSGGVTLIQMLNMAEQYNLDSIGFGSAQYVHLLTEFMRRGYANRAAYLGDPGFNPDMPVDLLVSKEFASQMAADIDPNKASVSDTTKIGYLNEGDNTTHFSVMDKNRMGVSMTYTLEYGYGSRQVIPELGFIFNNEMGDFNAIPGYTDTNGRIGTQPNLIEPGKRMLSSMSPSIVKKDGQIYLLTGSLGGRTIISAVFQHILNVIEHNMDVDDAVEVGQIHHQWFPDIIRYERHKLSPDTRRKLEEMGHKLTEWNTLGFLAVIQFNAELNLLHGWTDSSMKDGGVVGY